jgi:hypothetical protein
MPKAISEHFTDEQFTPPASLEEKVAIFADRVWGWQLNVADRMRADAHAGFAILAVVASYFEMIAKYQEGFVGPGASKDHFKKGVQSVLTP